MFTEITGNPNVGFKEEDIEGDFDPKKYDEAMQVIWNKRKSNQWLHRVATFRVACSRLSVVLGERITWVSEEKNLKNEAEQRRAKEGEPVRISLTTLFHPLLPSLAFVPPAYSTLARVFRFLLQLPRAWNRLRSGKSQGKTKKF